MQSNTQQERGGHPEESFIVCKNNSSCERSGEQTARTCEFGGANVYMETTVKRYKWENTSRQSERKIKNKNGPPHGNNIETGERSTANRHRMAAECICMQRWMTKGSQRLGSNPEFWVLAKDWHLLLFRETLLWRSTPQQRTVRVESKRRSCGRTSSYGGTSRRTEKK